MKISEKLIARLRQEFPQFNEDVPENEKPRRLYHGYYQRASGAWSWAIGGTMTCFRSYGSSWNMKDLLNAEFLSLYIEPGGDISVIPEK